METNPPNESKNPPPKLKELIQFLDQTDKDNLRKAQILSNAVTAFKAPLSHHSETNTGAQSPRRPGSARGRSNSRSRQRDADELTPAILPDVDHFSKNLELKQTLQEQKAQLFTMEFELGEKIKIIESLKKSLQEAQTKEVELHKKAQLSEKKKLLQQQKELEDVMNRQLAFIDNLVKDKQQLSEQCDKLSKELANVQKRYEDKIKVLQNSHASAVKTEKKKIQQEEHGKREKLLLEQAEEIKLATIRGLEPEVQKMIAKHKEEILNLKNAHELQMKEAHQTLATSYELKMKEMWDRLKKEKHEDLERERERNAVASKESHTASVNQLSQLREKLQQEFLIEKSRMEDRWNAQKTEYEIKIANLIEKGFQDREREARTAEDTFKARLTKEVRETEEKLRSNFEREYLQRYESIKAKLTAERDEDIEHIVARFEDETTNAKKAAEMHYHDVIQNFEQQISNLNQQILAAHQQTKIWEAKYLEQSNLREQKIGDIRERDETIQENKIEIEHLKGVLTKTVKEWEQRLKDDVAKEVDKRKNLEKKMEDMKISFEKDQLKPKQEEITKLHDALEELNVKVRQTVANKELIIEKLQDELETAKIKAQQLQMLLENRSVARSITAFKNKTSTKP